MCYGGGSASPDEQNSWNAEMRKKLPQFRQQISEEWDTLTPEERTKRYGAKYDGWTKEQVLADYDRVMGGAQQRLDASLQRNLGDSYIDPATGRRKGSIPGADYTDEAIKKARTNALQRMQLGKNQKNSFSGGTLGGFDISKPVLGGY